MPSTRTQEVLYESEAALRLVDHELNQLHDISAAGEALADSASHARVVNEANAQIMQALVRLRERSAAQPLSEAADLLHEMERRMTAVSKLLETPDSDGASNADAVIFKSAS